MTQTLEPETIAAHRPARSSPRRHERPPAIIVGGGADALSVTRNLGRMGVAVYVLNENAAFVRYSRYCRRLDAPIAAAGDEARVWAEFLLGSSSDALAGAVLLACSDAGIEMIAAHREALAEKYLLDESHPPAQLAMLNKLATYQAAVAAGVPTPGFWLADSPDELDDIRDRLVYPLIVKPRYSHIFESRTGRKLIIAKDFDEVVSAVATITATGTGCMLVEMIPGPDDRLCSYFTYLDEQSRPLLQFTKRVIRRYPALMGSACYHVTDWNPKAAEWGDRLFRYVGLRGLANVEFKHDVRDGQLKLIECNARFVASDTLVTRAGVNLAELVYNRIVGRAQPPRKPYIKGLRLWDPVRDFQAGLKLRKAGEMTFAGWLASVMHRQTFPWFSWSDPKPAFARLTAPLRRRFALGPKAGGPGMIGALQNFIRGTDSAIAAVYLSLFRERDALMPFLFHSLFRNQREIALNHVDPLQRTTTSQFRQFIEYYLDNGYRFISPDELLAGLAPGVKYALITFDDGYFNNSLAVPILREFNVPALFFISTNHVQQHKGYWWDVLHRERASRGVPHHAIYDEAISVKHLRTDQIEAKLVAEFGRDALVPRGDIDRPFTPAELQEFASNPQVHLGNHTADHAILTNYSDDDARQQIRTAQIALQSMTGRLPTSIAYPNGGHSDRIVEICREEGLKLGFTVRPEKRRLPIAADSELLRLGRFTPHGDAPIVTQCRTYRSDLLFYGKFRAGYLRLRRGQIAQ